MNYRSLLIACLATLGLAVAGWGHDGKDADNPADPSLSEGIGQASGGEAWVVGAIRRLTDSAGYRSPVLVTGWSAHRLRVRARRQG